MNLQVESVGDIQVVRVREPRLVFQTLTSFTDYISDLMIGGTEKLLIDMSQVQYIDSASIGGIVDLYRKSAEGTGSLKLVGLQGRVERMINLVGLHNLIDIYREEKTAIDSFN